MVVQLAGFNQGVSAVIPGVIRFTPLPRLEQSVAGAYPGRKTLFIELLEGPSRLPQRTDEVRAERDRLRGGNKNGYFPVHVIELRAAGQHGFLHVRHFLEQVLAMALTGLSQ